MNPGDACPWSDWAPGTVQFCEARLCAVVREPANAWSSMAYLVIALWMIRRGGFSSIVILAQVLVGVGSFFFHATGTFAGEMVDQVGMYVLSALVLAHSIGEARGLNTKTIGWLWGSVVVVSALANLAVRPIGIPLFAVQLLVGQVWQIRHGMRSPAPRYRDFYTGLGIFGVSLAIWVTDITRVVCNPDLHWFGGHAVWHTLNAISILFLGRFYAAMPTKNVVEN
jgi:hypothetical protein